MMAALAAAPIAVILLLMLGRRWPAARAGLAALLLAAVLAPVAFGFGSGAAEWAGVAAEAASTTATILWILWPALALHDHQQRCGAIDALQTGLVRLTPTPLHQALLIGWFLPLFFEGAAGFGTPIALAAPMLMGLGFAPVHAVVLALLGHAAGVSFGALGTPVLTQALLTGESPGDLAWRTALLHVLAGGLLMAFFARSLQAGQGGGAGQPAIAAALFLLPCLLLASLLGPELATLGAALFGGITFVLLQRRTKTACGTAPARLPWALAPYGVLVALVIAMRFVPVLAQAHAGVVLEWQWLDRYGARMQPLAHPGTLLLAALFMGAALQRVPLREAARSLAAPLPRLLPVAVALFAMLALSRLMLHAGMVETLQSTAIRWVGGGWPLIAPAVGALGSFVTGSATASNALFSTLQAQTAGALGLPVATVLAAQGFGAAIGNIVCPHNIVAGAATVGLADRESEILRRTLVPCLAYAGAGGLLVAAWIALERASGI